MNWEALAAIGETAGAIGVIVTLLFLIKQLRDNTLSVRSAAGASYMQAYSSVNGRASDPARSRISRIAMEDPSALTADELVSFNFMMSERLSLYESLCRMHLDGTIHGAHWGVARSDMISLLQTDAAKDAISPLLPIYDRYFPEFAAELRAALEGENLLYDMKDAFPIDERTR
jgi:hypothetical protein